MDGVLIVDKPEGLTSHSTIKRVQRILRASKVGHTGTLDPFATGVLVALVGRATRLAQFLSGAEKEYDAVVRLGYSTDTGDLTGERRWDKFAYDVEMDWPDDEIEDALATLRGEIEQIPPMYSAKKVQGQRLYEIARRGIEVERQAVRVHVYELEAKRMKGELLKMNRDGTLDLSVRVLCSSGTYVRALAESIGERLGVGAHLAALRRTRAGSFRIGEAKSLEELERIALSSKIDEILIRMDAALSWLPFLHLTERDARRAVNGLAVTAPQALREKWPEGQWVRMLDGLGNLVAVGSYRSTSCDLHPRVVLSPEK